MAGKADPDDRFGMPREAFEAAIEAHGKDNPLIRLRGRYRAEARIEITVKQVRPKE